MPVVDVINLEGKTVGQLNLADDVFGARVNPHLLHETVRHYLAVQRAGTHKTKAKSEVSGAGRKLWRQKGTGRARIGSIRSPLWRKGGTVHGPVPRSYSYHLSKKMVARALCSALSEKLLGQQITIVDGWPLETHKAKAFRQVLSKLDGGARTTLLVEGESNANLERASRNLAGVKLVTPRGLVTYDLLRHERLVLSKDSALRLSRSLSRQEPEPAPVQIEPAPAVAPAATATPAAEAKPRRPRKKAKE